MRRGLTIFHVPPSAVEPKVIRIQQIPGEAIAKGSALDRLKRQAGAEPVVIVDPNLADCGPRTRRRPK